MVTMTSRGKPNVCDVTAAILNLKKKLLNILLTVVRFFSHSIPFSFIFLFSFQRLTLLQTLEKDMQDLQDYAHKLLELVEDFTDSRP